jgi:hypothetical protein
MRVQRFLLGLVLFFATGAVWAQGDGVRRAVFHDRRYPGSWVNGVQSAIGREYFNQRGYTGLDADQLKNWMRDRISDGQPSIVLFMHDVAPDTVVETVTADCTLRRYLEAGGRVVWVGDVPLWYTGRRNGQVTRLMARGSRSVLGFNADWTPYDVTLETETTETGSAWGIRNTWQSYRPISPSLVDRVLAVHPNGLPAAWSRFYGDGPRRGQFVRTHDAPGLGNLEDLYRVAEYVEPPRTLPSPGGDFSDPTAGAFAAPDGAGAVTGRWLKVGIGAAAEPGGARRGTSFLSYNGSSAGGRNAWRFSIRTGANRGMIQWYVEPEYIRPGAETPAFVSVEYFDGNAGVVLGLEYSTGQTTFRPARGTVLLAGTGRWRRATWYLPDARWDKLQAATNANSGSDLRFFVLRGPTSAASGVHVGSIRVLTERQARLAPPAGRQLVFSVTRPGVLDADLAPMTEELRAAAPFIRASGAASHENVVYWSRVEKEAGVYDFAFTDALVALHRELGLKWAPLLVLGPPESLPAWYFTSDQRQGLVSLERGDVSHIPSIWDPRLRERVRGFLKAFGERYRDTGVLESVTLGISGVDGTARFPTTRPPSPDGPGPYGSYPTYDGYWAGDPFAVAHFRQAMQARYGTIAALNAAWETRHASFEAVAPFLPTRAPSLAARRDFSEWYSGSMLEYARFWLAAAREFLPDVSLQIRTGGDGSPEQGSDFAGLAEIAAQYRAGVRLVHGGSDYLTRFSLTRPLDSAARFYRTTTTHESNVEISDESLLARIFNAASPVVGGLKESGLWFDRPETFDAWLTRSRYFREWPAATEIACFYPQTHIRLYGSSFLKQEYLPAVQELRAQFDFDMVSERTIAAGALDRYRALVFGPGDVWDTTTIERILSWVRAGGLLVAPSRADLGLLFPRVTSGGSRAMGSGQILVARDDPAFGPTARAVIISRPGFDSATRNALAAGDPNLGVFATPLPPGGMLLLNASDAPVTRSLILGGQSQTIALPPQSIVPVGVP